MDEQLHSVLERAVESPCGIRIATPDVDGLRRRLYAYRGKARALGDERFDHLLLTISPEGRGELWIINRRAA